MVAGVAAAEGEQEEAEEVTITLSDQMKARVQRLIEAAQ